MSYCRWSSMNFWSDVYTYPHVDGTWTTHVAESRYVGTPPDDTLPMIGKVSREEFLRLSRERSAWFDAAEHQDIGLPHDGKTFKDPDPATCAETLKMLRGAGYHVPQFAIDALLEEAAEIVAS